MLKKRSPRGNGHRPEMGAEQIIEAALAVIDERGLSGLSMRVLADRLSVYPTTLYWHIQDRNNLLACVVQRVLKGILPKPAKDWREWVKALMRQFRAAVMRHPNVAPLIGADLTSNPGVDLAIVDRLLNVLEQAGFKDGALVEAYNTIMAGMIGFVTLELAAPPAEETEAWAAALQARFEMVTPDQYPTLGRLGPKLANSAFVVRWRGGASLPLDNAFDSFTRTILLGLERQLDGQTAKIRPPRSKRRTSQDKE